MLDLLILRPDLVAPVTIHKVLVIGTVVVAIAVAFRRFGLATITTVPLIALVGVDEFHPTAAGRTVRQARQPGRSAHHAVTAWFVAGVGLVALFLVFALVVSFLTAGRAQRSDVPPCYPDPTREQNRVAEAPPWSTPAGKRGRRPGGRNGTAARRVSRPAEYLPHLRRLSLLTREFLLCVHEGWPVPISLRSDDTRWFLDALLHATVLVVDNRAGLPAAVAEAERRWVFICSQSGPGEPPSEENIPDRDPDHS